MLKSRAVILAKAESTYNTDAVPVAGVNAILVENLSPVTWEGARMAERAPIRASFGKLRNIYAGTLGQVTFDVEIKGSGAAGTAPELGVLLKGCGFSETIVPATSVAYAAASSNHSSLTIYVYEDGLRYILTGCRGMVTAAIATGSFGKLSFTFVGHVSGPTDQALPTATYNSVVPPPAINAPFTIDSYSAVISKIDIDWGLALAKPDNLAGADGYGEIQITDRKPTVTIDPLATLVAAYDWITKWKSSAAYALNSGTIGPTAGNRYAITMPAVAYQEIGGADREGIISREVKGLCEESTGDDEIVLTFT